MNIMSLFVGAGGACRRSYHVGCVVSDVLLFVAEHRPRRRRSLREMIL